MNLIMIHVRIPKCSCEEFDRIDNYIKKISYDELSFNPVTREGVFSVSEHFDIGTLNLPAPCQILR